MQNCIFCCFWYYICGKSDGFSYDELRAVSSAQIAILHRTSSGKQL